MNLFLLNLLLAVLWAAASGNFRPATLAAGFVLGYLVLFLTRPILGPSSYHARLWRAIAFAGWFLWELVASGLRVARDVVMPGLRFRPGVLAVPLDVRSDAEITMLANLISLTPGSLSLDISPDRRVLYVHAMDIEDGDVDAYRARLKSGMERRVRELFR